MTPPRPLRVGLLLDDEFVPDWMATPLLDATRINAVEVCVAIIRAADQPVVTSRPRKWWQNRRLLLSALVMKWDARRAGMRGPPPQSLREVAPNADRLVVAPHVTRFTDTITEADVARVRSYQLDVLIRVGFRIIKGGILSAARHGVVAFHHGDNRVNRGGPTGVWEVLLGEEVSGVTLQVMSEELDGGRVLAWSVGLTRARSMAGNRAALFARSPAILFRTLLDLHRGGDGVQASAQNAPAWDASDRRILRYPTNRETWRHGRRIVSKSLRTKWEWLGKDHQWTLAWHYRNGVVGDAPYGGLHRYNILATPPDRFHADPWVVRDGGTWWVFYEEVVYATHRGRIGVWQFGPKGPIGDPRIVLERPYHLSYPQVFRFGETWYMVPESMGSGSVELYRASRFPDEWVLERPLIDGLPLIDATLLHHNNRTYLFGNLAAPGIDPDDELHLFVSEGPFGPFVPHPQSPIVTDVRHARMAGRIFHQGGVLHRPAQCGAPRYGAGMVIHEIDELSPETYREHVTHRLFPHWNRSAIGLHTISAADGLSLIDMRLKVPRRKAPQ